MGKIRIFKTIPQALPRERVLRRLGYRQGLTRLAQKQQEEIAAYLQEAASLLELKGASVRLAIGSQSGKFMSSQLEVFLKGCDEMLLIAATSGSRVTRAIGRAMQGKNVTWAVVADAVASETVDAALDWIMQYNNQELRRENKQLTKKRFSCGYGDFLLENQKIIYDILHLERIGIKITDSFILQPEKSVTAVVGIKGAGI